MNAIKLVNQLLDNALESRLDEASVHRPPRSNVWVATITGANPGEQIRRSTGQTDREQALVIAQKWEVEERERRKALARQDRLPHPRKSDPGGFTQEEVAALLKMSARAVRNTEKRALAKLRRHPAVRDLWREITGEVVKESEELPLAKEEMVALVGLAKTVFDLRTLQKLIRDISVR